MSVPNIDTGDQGHVLLVKEIVWTTVILLTLYQDSFLINRSVKMHRLWSKYVLLSEPFRMLCTRNDDMVPMINTRTNNQTTLELCEQGTHCEFDTDTHL